MQQHIQSFLMDHQKVEMWKKENTTPFIKIDPTENEDMLNRLVSQLKHQYIIDNMDEYKRAYFPEELETRVMTDTFICDNGGFESDFLFYKGYSTTFNSGSNTCAPFLNNNPSQYVPTPVPTSKQFEIATTGTDPISGLQKVKFGNKSLKLNDPYSHVTNSPPLVCRGENSVNKLVKRFLVTEENRDFTVWYALALENPANHEDTQPFFSIACDLAPLSDLCFDADILDCDSTYSQPNCNPELMDVLDWSCHRIKIPASEVGNIATLEIVMGDCGQGAHNGYAYIDGICEGCSGSALGSVTLSDAELDPPGIGINYLSCEGDIARICGRYTEPFVCGEWYLDSIAVPGYTITNVSIDTVNQIFCFDFSITNFPSASDIELYVAGFFKRNGGGALPVIFSNSIIIKMSLFVKQFDVNYDVSLCFSNSDPDDHNISDDYYFVDVSQILGTNEAWSIERQLLDPYLNESGLTNLDSGNGPFNLHLGPFLIQEGSWEMIVTIGNCTYIYVIEPPEFCSGTNICNNFKTVKIGNVVCTTGDRWSFDLLVPGPSSTSSTKFTLIGPGGSVEYLYGSSIINLPMGLIGYECIEFQLIDNTNPTCQVFFTVCPPKPCSQSCDLEVNISKAECVRHNTDDYYITLDVDASTTVCYNTTGDIGSGSNNSPVPSGGLIGSFDEDVTIVVFLCPGGVCSLCVAPSCYKVLKVFQPDCESEDYGGIGGKISSTERSDKSGVNHNVTVIPNPVNGQEMMVYSKLPKTIFEIINNKGQKIFSHAFEGKQFLCPIGDLPVGIYFLQYLDVDQKVGQISFIKQ